MAVSNNNVKNIQFLRNGNPAETRQLAIDALEAQKANVADGSIILARYGSGTDIKTLAGLVYVSGSTRTVTIIDVEGADADVEALRTEINNKLGNGVGSGTGESVTEQLTALSGSAGDTSATTSVAGAKAYAKDYTDEQISGLDYSGVTTGDGVVVTNVTEADGKVAATAAEVGGLKLTNYAKGSDATAVANTDTINEAISKLENQIATSTSGVTEINTKLGTGVTTANTATAQFAALSGNASSTSADTSVEGAKKYADEKIAQAVDGLDYTDTAVTGSYVSKVDEADGVISVTRVALPSVADSASAKTFVTSVSENLGEISVTKGTVSSTGNTVVLTDNADGGINIEVASSALIEYVGDNETIEVSPAVNNQKTISTLLTLSSVTPSSTTVKEEYALVDASGVTKGQTVKIYKDSSVVSIDYQDNPEQAHYQNLIYTYIDASGNTQTEYVDMSALVLEAEFASGVTFSNGVAHGVVDSTSEKDSNNDSFLTVGADGFKVDGIKDEIAAEINTAIAGLDVSGDTAVAGQYVAAIKETDGIVAVKTRANVSEAVLNNYAQGSASGAVASTDTINEAFGKVENQIAAINSVVDNLDASVTGGTTAGTATANHVQVIVDEADGKLTAVTVTETNIADADDLAELSGKTVTEVASSNDSITAALSAATDGTKHLDIITDASKIKMSGFTPVDTASSLSNIAVSSSVTEAFQEVDRVITENEQTVSAALNDLEETKVENINVNGVEGTFSNKVASVTIDGADIKLDGYASGSSSGAVVATDTVNQAIGKLENQVKQAVAGGLQQVEAGSGITVSAVADNKQTITAKLSSAGLPSGIAENAIKFDSTDNGMYIEYIDAGTY